MVDINPFEEKPPTPPKNFWSIIKKPWFLLGGALFIFMLAVGLSINSVMQSLLHSKSEVVVPNLEGKGLLESLNLVSTMDLSLRQDGAEFDESLPAGTILRQQPPSGMRVRSGRAIRVVVSKGGQVVFVPNILDKALAEAQSLLALDRLQIGAIAEVFSVDYNAGMTVSQNPSSGTVVTRGALVDVTVSKGLPPAGAPLLPNFIGKSIDEVQKWADGLNSKVKMSEDPKAVGPAGTVVKQSPLEGQPLLEGESIHITVVPVVGSEKGIRLSYEIPRDKGQVVVKMVARDNRGESEVYKGTHKGGEKIEVPMSVNVTTRVRIYLDDILQDERVVEP